MKFMLLGGIAALSLGLAVQDPFDAAEITATQVSGPVYMLEGYGGNIGLVLTEGGPVMIDDQFAQLEDKIRAAVEELAGTKNPSYVLNTHFHGDHTGSNEGFGTTSVLVAHDKVRTRLLAGDRREGPAPASALPVLTHADGMTLHLGGQTVELRHYPAAHTDGDSVVIFHEAKVVHMGDIMFHGMFPFIDRDSGGTVKGYLSALKNIHEDLPADWKVIPGHGPLASRADIKALHDMILATGKIVAARKAEGMSMEDCVAEGLPKEWDSWSWQFISTDAWIQTLYQRLD